MNNEKSPRRNSTYSRLEGGVLVTDIDGSPQMAAGQISLYHSMFRTLVLNSDYPCVGAKAAFNRGTYRFGLYQELGETESTLHLHADLERYAQERSTMDAPYRTFVACFSGPFFPDETTFENALWHQLQSLHNVDVVKHIWDPSVSSDPSSPDFSFSIGGTAFFIVALHPASSRIARQFMLPTLVFNAHDQFETLRQQGLFERIKNGNRLRDVALQGQINPNLVDFGDASEATQYSGKRHDNNWKCPFHPHH